MNIKYILIILILTMVPLYITGLNASDNQKKMKMSNPLCKMMKVHIYSKNLNVQI